MLVCEWCLINVHHDVALHSVRLLNNFDDIKKAYTGTTNINMANKPRVLLGSSNKRLGPWQCARKIPISPSGSGSVQCTLNQYSPIKFIPNFRQCVLG